MSTEILRKEDMAAEYRQLVTQLMESQAYRELAAAHMFGYGLQYVPDQWLRFMVWHIREEAEHYEAVTGSLWRPRSGSMVNHRALTSAMIDSREFIAAQRRAEAQLLVPAGSRIAFTGGSDFNDHQRIWAALDRVHAKHPDMVLLHGGTPKGAERIAACWADQRKVPQIVFKPDWHRHAKAAPFKRNDALLETLPIGVIVFPGSGVTDNLADKAKRLGIPLFDFRGGGG